MPVSISFPRRFCVDVEPAGLLACDVERRSAFPASLVVSGTCARCHLQLRGSFRFDGIPYTGTMDVNELSTIYVTLPRMSRSRTEDSTVQ